MPYEKYVRSIKAFSDYKDQLFKFVEGMEISLIKQLVDFEKHE